MQPDGVISAASELVQEQEGQEEEVNGEQTCGLNCVRLITMTIFIFWSSVRFDFQGSI